MTSSQLDLTGKRVLVTGGTGFIGGRLIERLVLECHAIVRVLVHTFDRAYRIARFPIELVRGDITQRDDVEQAIAECEMVFHCAYGNAGDDEKRRLVNVEGTKNILEAALRAGAKRVVHLSTVAVYGWGTPDGSLDETAPRRYSGNAYSDSKLDSEQLALRYTEEHGLPVVVLQPTVVYGPFSLPWTVNVLRQLQTGRVILVNDGDGLCNAVYVDDVVSAILRAAMTDQATGEAFLIAGEGPITWREFYGGFERILGLSRTVNMSVAEAHAYYVRKQREARAVKSLLQEVCSILREEANIRTRLLRTRELATVRRVGRFFMPQHLRQWLRTSITGHGSTAQLQTAAQQEPPIHPLNPLMVQLYASKTQVCIDKAKSVLGYQPVFDFTYGLSLTEQWVKWSNLHQEVVSLNLYDGMAD
jgi:nucleoside-diphosphate-sugar epimerase